MAGSGTSTGAGKGKGGGGVAAGDVRQCQWGEEGVRRGVHCQRRLFSFLGDLQFAEAIFRSGSASSIHCHRVFSIFTVVAAVKLGRSRRFINGFIKVFSFFHLVSSVGAVTFPV